MATAASQPYIARLGFQDPDRSKDRHGLACEYLFERLMNSVASGPEDRHQKAAGCINFAIKSGYSVVGFADVFVSCTEWDKDRYGRDYHTVSGVLGEVKISRQPAEQVLQQINFYKIHIKPPIKQVFVLVDYDCSDLQRLTEGSDIKVFRLGQRFEEWIQSRPNPEAPEL